MEYAVEMRNICKSFGPLRANDDITLNIAPGEIRALLGENGAGKSTLMSILFGIYHADSGEIYIHGKKAEINGPNDANAAGIGMVHQHFKLIPNFTVLENIMLGVEPIKRGMLDPAAAREKVTALSEKYGLAVNPDSLIRDITVGMQQRVEILKVLYRENDILIFDEPTAVLLPQEIDELLNIIQGLSQEGKTILFISHKLEEIKRIAENCSVLRRGKLIGTVPVGETKTADMAAMMVGRPVLLEVEKADCAPGEVLLRVENLCVRDKISHKKRVSDVSFEVRAGEIACIAGVDGNGQSELVSAIAGLIPSTGSVTLSGQELSGRSVRWRNTHGLSHIPEDRQRHGLTLEYTISENLVMQEYFMPRFSKNGFLKFDSMSEYAKNLIGEYDIRSGRQEESLCGELSGGNQQKVILARELEREHTLVIAVQPTRGLDVGAIEQVHRQLVSQRDAGKGVLLVSLEMEEVLSLSDRIMVLCDGEMVAHDLDPRQVDLQELGLYMVGSKREGGTA